MFASLNDIDINWLKNNHTRLYYFGLGFIQLKIDEIWRLHFYTQDLPAITEDIHNHRYDFESKTLKGVITNCYYKVIEGDTHVIQNESCNPDIDAPALNKPCAVELDTVSFFQAGDVNKMTHDQFHVVYVRDECITLLKRSDYKKEFAQVIVSKETESICPFSKEVPQDELWGIIERMIRG